MIMLPYSAKKNMAKMIDEYSTLYPATSSASASGRSNGVLFVSATIEIRKIRARGISGKINQTVAPWAATISVKLSDPAMKITGINTRLIETSYEIICAAERRAPRKAYLELLAQPAIIIPYTVSELSAKITSSP
jgi:hypothetical protein